MTNTDMSLRDAAQAVIDRWETPLWKDAPATAAFIADLRDALARDAGRASLQSPGFSAEDMATASAQGFRDGVASVAASAPTPSAHIKEPYTLAEIKAKIASNDYGAELLLQHAMALLDSASLAASAGEPVAWQYRSLPDVGGVWFECSKERAEQRAAHPDRWEVRQLYAAPPTAQAGGWKDGIEAVAKMLEKKADDFAQQHGYEDMGSLSFGRGPHADAKLDHHSLLCELAEEVRGLTPPTSAEGVEP